MDFLKDHWKGLVKALPRRPSLALAWPLLPAAGLAVFLLHGCQREFDSPYHPRSDGYVGPEWSLDGDGDGISDSVEKYAPGCGGDPETCLRKARENAGIAEGLDSVTARDLDLVAGGPPVAPDLAWHPQSEAAPYALASDNPAVAAAADSLVRPVAPGQAVFTVTVRADSGPPLTARFRVNVAIARVRVTSVSASDLVLEAGRSAVPEVVVYPAIATDKGYELLTHDPGVAEARGIAMLGIAPGTTRVTVRSSDGGHEALFRVTVRPAPVAVRGVKVEDMVFALLASVDERRRVPSITWTPEDATDKGYTLASEHPEVARVVGDSIEAMRNGETKVTLTTRDGGRKDTFKVRVNWIVGCGGPIDPCPAEAGPAAAAAE